MSWEHTDISLAPRAGRADELRDDAARSRQRRELMRQSRGQRAQSIRSRIANRLVVLADLITPTEGPSAEVLPAE